MTCSSNSTRCSQWFPKERAYEAHIVPFVHFQSTGVIRRTGIRYYDNSIIGDQAANRYMPVYATRTTVIGKGDREGVPEIGIKVKYGIN